MYQVVIIGAGPVGGRLATELASRGISTLMVEEHAEIGRPFQCAGLVNPPAMQMVGLENTILQNIDGVKTIPTEVYHLVHVALQLLNLLWP